VVGHGDGRVTVRDINAGSETDDMVHFKPTDNIFADMGE
jgi:ribose 5-phosphate isomerase A